MAGAEENAAVIGDRAPPNPSPRTLIADFLNDGHLGSSGIANLKDGDVECDDGFRFLTQRPGGVARSGLAERAARAGFSAPTINTADVPSSYVTIPPGLSPTMLLESPVFLSNAMAQPSPTTGKFSFEQCNNTNSNSTTGGPDMSNDHLLEDIPGSFTFRPPMESSSSYFTRVEKKGSSIEHQTYLPSIEMPVLSEQANAIKNQQNFRVPARFPESSIKNDAPDDIIFNQRMSDSFNDNEHASPPEDLQEGDGDSKGESSAVVVGAPAEDGYNWRKYGQKQVKGSEYPRSYYKCTHPNCQVKKKVERSREGHITEIIYKGAHNHPKPPPNRRSGIFPHPYSEMQRDGSQHPSSQTALDGKQLWTSTQNWRNDGRESTSSASVPTEFVDPSAPFLAQEGPRFESDLIDVSTTPSNDEDEDDRATHGSVSVGGEGEGDETESKRRKLDTCAIEMSAASRAVREPRVVVQTTSEVDILDDGYRWRKYGQKVVKGNPNPRSYYKCTNPGCTVRKHVERASHDLKSVITTYEGKHNHDVPAARNGGNTSSGPTITASTLASQSHDLHRRPEPVQVQDNLMRFNGPATLAAFGLPGREQLGPSASFHFGMGQQGLTNLALTGLSAVAPLKMLGLPPAHPYTHHQAIDGGFMLPKGEPKEEPVLETSLPMSNGASVYRQIMECSVDLVPVPWQTKQVTGQEVGS